MIVRPGLEPVAHRTTTFSVQTKEASIAAAISARMNRHNATIRSAALLHLAKEAAIRNRVPTALLRHLGLTRSRVLIPRRRAVAAVIRPRKVMAATAAEVLATVDQRQATAPAAAEAPLMAAVVVLPTVVINPNQQS